MSIKRNDGEEYAAFKQRQLEANWDTEIALKPKMFWDSYMLGTYVNKEKQAAKQLKGNK